MTRRDLFIKLGLLSAVYHAADARVDGFIDNRSAPHLSVADGAFQACSSEARLKRLKTLKDVGFGVLRSSLGRINPTGGVVSNENQESVSFLKLAASLGFSLKLAVGAGSEVSDVFFDNHPDALLRNSSGGFVSGCMSPWYPDRGSVLSSSIGATLEILSNSDLTNSLAAIVADLGAAAEPIYPASWELKAGQGQESYWFYDVHAQQAFGDDMKSLYNGNLEIANRIWSTGFSSWRDVVTPRVGCHSGKMWEDTLTWYRDAKRSMIELSLSTLLRVIRSSHALKKTPVIILLPGTHLPVGTLQEVAAAAGRGNEAIQAMIDTDFLIRLATKLGCDLQSTASQNDQEVKFINSRIAFLQSQSRLWAENAGGSPAKNPEHLAQIVIRNKLYGFEYINASEILTDRGDKVPELFSKVSLAVKQLRTHFSTEQ